MRAPGKGREKPRQRVLETNFPVRSREVQLVTVQHTKAPRESGSTRAFLTYSLPSLSYPQGPWELVATSNGVLRELSSLIDLPGVQTLWPSGEEAVLRHEAGGSWGVGKGAGSDSYSLVLWSPGALRGWHRLVMRLTSWWPREA